MGFLAVLRCCIRFCWGFSELGSCAVFDENRMATGCFYDDCANYIGGFYHTISRFYQYLVDPRAENYTVPQK